MRTAARGSNAALFFYDYTDQQVNQFVNGEFTVVSVDSDISGAEAELTWLPAEGTYVDAGLAFLDTEITRTANAPQLGNKLLNAPEFTARLAVRKEWSMANGALLGVGVDGRYADERYFNLDNAVSDDGYTIVNAQAFYEFGPESQYRVSVWGKNIFDELYYNNRFEFDDNGDGITDYHTVYLSEPATYGVSFNLSF